MKITTMGIDLAKSVFAFHGVNEHGRAVLKKVLKRDNLIGTSLAYSIRDSRPALGTEVRMHGCNQDLCTIAT